MNFNTSLTLYSTLRHPHIVQYLGTTIKPPHLYIITEYCERGNMKHIIRFLSETNLLIFSRNKSIVLSLKKTVKLALDAAKGMLYLHSLKPPILHRDLKSANLLVKF